MVVQHNIPAINANRQLGVNNSSLSKSLEKLSSGFKINRAADNAAGLAISEKMRGQINGLTQASTNAQDGISLIQTAEGALEETHSILQRMRELAVQSSNGTYQDKVDRENIEKEVEALKSEIDRISTSTHYNNIKLLDGTLKGPAAAAETYGTAVNITDATGGDLATNATATAKLTVAFTAASGTDAEKKTAVEAQNDFLDVLKEKGVNLKTHATATDKVESMAVEGYTVTLDATGLIGTVKKGSLEIGTITAAGTGGGSSDAFTADKSVNIKLTNTEIAGGAFTAGEPEAHAATDIKTPAKAPLILQIGANGSDDQRVELSVDDMSSKGIGVDTISVKTRSDANSAIDVIDTAINTVSGTRANLGALQNRMEHTIKSLDVSNENLTAAESRIRDVDMAKEMMQFTKNQILAQASQSMLAQANQLPQGVLQLLQ